MDAATGRQQKGRQQQKGRRQQKGRQQQEGRQQQKGRRQQKGRQQQEGRQQQKERQQHQGCQKKTPEAESKEKHGVSDLTITSPLSTPESTVYSNTFTWATWGNPMPESTLTLCQS
jgi:hypothetical protein